MGATFPNGIASFQEHRNLLDDVDAADINRIQDEIVAVQSVIGALVNEVHNVENEVQQIANAEAAEDAADAIRQQQTVKEFTSLKERLAYLEAGRHKYAIALSGGPWVIAPMKLSADPVVVPLPAPPSGHDPMGMYNGTGLTLKKSGFWLLVGHARYDTNDGQGNKNLGIYEADISLGGWLRRGADRDAPVSDHGLRNVTCNPIAMGWMAAGSVVSLRARQTTEVNQTITNGQLSAILLREF